MSETERRHNVWHLEDKRHPLKGYAGRGLGEPIRFWNEICQWPEALIGVEAKEIHFLRIGVW